MSAQPSVVLTTLEHFFLSRGLHKTRAVESLKLYDLPSGSMICILIEEEDIAFLCTIRDGQNARIVVYNKSKGIAITETDGFPTELYVGGPFQGTTIRELRLIGTGTTNDE